MALDIGPIDLLGKTPTAPNRASTSSSPALRWKHLSGRWEREPSGIIRYLHDASAKGGENLSLIGSRGWMDFSFSVTFRMLTISTRPPEGGVILYFLYRNKRNFYSCHFCQAKHKVEFVKRLGGRWNSTAECGIRLELHKDYEAMLSTASGVHSCFLDGQEVLRFEDPVILTGRVGLGVKYCDVSFGAASIAFPSRAQSPQVSEGLDFSR